MATPTSRSLEDGRYQVRVGETTFDIEIKDGKFLLDDEELDVTFEPITDSHFSLLLEGRSLPITVEPQEDHHMRVTVRGRRVGVQIKDERDLLLERFGLDEALGAGEQEIRAPMPGLILSVLVEPGEEVEAGAGLVVLEAMKMENELSAPAHGVVKTVHITEGDPVDKDALLIELEAK